MFNARQILDALVGAAAINPPAPQGGQGQQGGIGDILGQALGGGQVQNAGTGAGTGGGIGDLLGKMLGGGQGAGSGAGGLSGGLGDILGGMLGGGNAGATPAGGAGGQAPQVGGAAGGLLRQAIDFAQTPKGAAIIAGLAGLMMSKTGRTVAGPAAKLGGAALVGGLAYKAMQEWQAGSSPSGTRGSVPALAPAGTAFSADSQTNEEASALVQAMISAAAADGQVDEAERARIAGALGAALPKEAVDFLNAAFARPLTPEQLADAATGPEHAAQIYEAARLTIDPDTPAEQAFLAQLQQALGLDDGLVAHLDAAAMSARA